MLSAKDLSKLKTAVGPYDLVGWRGLMVIRAPTAVTGTANLPANTERYWNDLGILVRREHTMIAGLNEKFVARAK